MLLRSRSALRHEATEKDGHEGGHRDPFGPHLTAKEVSDNQDKNVLQLPDGHDGNVLSGDEDETESLDESGDTLAAGVKDIKNFDDTFNSEDFIVGARVAFEMVLDAYSNHDRETLGYLLSPEVLANFQVVIECVF